MPIQVSYSKARENLAKLIDEVIDHRDSVIIQRRGKEDVALIAVSELEGLMETAHLLRSPKNADRLLTALDRARRGEGQPESIEDLRNSLPSS